MCFCAVWFTSNVFQSESVWRPGLGFLTLLITFLGAEKVAGKPAESVPNHNDRHLLAKLREELPRDPLIHFFSETDFLIDFPGTPIREIEQFWRAWNNVEHQFADQQLEESRLGMLAAISNCLDRVATYATIEENDLWRVRTMDNRHQKRFEDMWRDQAAEINGFARKIVSHYEALLKRGRDKFPDPAA